MRKAFPAFQREALALPAPPAAMECFDISHISGTFVVAAMVRFTEATGQGGDWMPIEADADVPAWTDGFASILPVLKPFWERF